MKNIVFSGIISRVFLDEFVSCLSLIKYLKKGITLVTLVMSKCLIFLN